jgi:hypothetical protein
VVGVKLKPLIEVAEPFTVTLTFCELVDWPTFAVKNNCDGLATTPLPLVPMFKVTGTLTEPKAVERVSKPE